MDALLGDDRGDVAGDCDHAGEPGGDLYEGVVEALKQQMAGAPRFALQAALMPYQNLLPERYRGRNERIDEPLA